MKEGYCMRGDAPVYFCKRVGGELRLIGKKPSDPVSVMPSELSFEDLLPLKKRVDGETVPREMALANFLAMRKLFGGMAELLATKTHRGILSVPAKKNKSFVALVGERDERELRSESVKFVFGRYLHRNGKRLDINYPEPLKNKKAAERVRRVAQYVAANNALAGEGERFTQKEIAEKLGISRQRVQQIIATPLFRSLLRAVNDGLYAIAYGKDAKLDADEICRNADLIPQEINDELIFLYSPNIGESFLFREFLLTLDIFGVSTKKSK